MLEHFVWVDQSGDVTHYRMSGSHYPTSDQRLEYFSADIDRWRRSMFDTFEELQKDAALVKAQLVRVEF